MKISGAALGTFAAPAVLMAAAYRDAFAAALAKLDGVSKKAVGSKR